MGLRLFLPFSVCRRPTPRFLVDQRQQDLLRFLLYFSGPLPLIGFRITPSLSLYIYIFCLSLRLWFRLSFFSFVFVLFFLRSAPLPPSLTHPASSPCLSPHLFRHLSLTLCSATAPPPPCQLTCSQKNEESQHQVFVSRFAHLYAEEVCRARTEHTHTHTKRERERESHGRQTPNRVLRVRVLIRVNLSLEVVRLCTRVACHFYGLFPVVVAVAAAFLARFLRGQPPSEAEPTDSRARRQGEPEKKSERGRNAKEDLTKKRERLVLGADVLLLFREALV